MSQYDFGTIDPYVVDGVQLADMLNNWRDAIHSWHRSGTRPSYAVPGMMWINDSGGASNWVVNVYLGGSVGDKPLFNYNTTTGAITWAAPVPAVDNFIMTTGANLVVPANSFASIFITGASPTVVQNNGAPVTHDPATGSFTVAKAGTFDISLNAYIESASGTATLSLQLQVLRSGSPLLDIRHNIVGVPGGGGGLSQTMAFNVGDVINCRAANNAAAAGPAATLYALSSGQLSGGHFQYFSAVRR